MLKKESNTHIEKWNWEKNLKEAIDIWQLNKASLQ